MQLKHLADSAVLALPDDLLWADEHAWTPAVAAVSYLLTGALLVESAARQKGRPLTLVGAADMAWVTRAAVNTLYAWAASPASRFELTLADGRAYTVAFRHNETAIEAEPVTGFPAWREGDFYRLTVRFMEV
ncbi:hypothetical protein [Ralstonia pseudosolanacearum]|uniref:hypothetical protein n=1 Tax=Ralstonia pseudosolanacearum TaxID=1310165 RepID=UPI001FFA9635|nr:hypothetical protein [Ralstonia pseudosolanacearum]